MLGTVGAIYSFQSTYLYKVRPAGEIPLVRYHCFNPRTYIRYDQWIFGCVSKSNGFQSTYLYKVRLVGGGGGSGYNGFQSTYLYKVRLRTSRCQCNRWSFNPRTYIRYDPCRSVSSLLPQRFNPRTYIRYDNTNFKV